MQREDGRKPGATGLSSTKKKKTANNGRGDDNFTSTLSKEKTVHNQHTFLEKRKRSNHDVQCEIDATPGLSHKKKHKSLYGETVAGTSSQNEAIYYRHRVPEKRKLSDDNDHVETKRDRKKDKLSVIEDERLLDIFDRKREIIMADVDPSLFEDDLVEFGELHQQIRSCSTGQKERISILLNDLANMPRKQKLQVLRAMSSKYDTIFTKDAAKASGNAATIEVKAYLKAPIQEQSAHFNFHSEAQRFREFDREMVSNGNKNLENQDSFMNGVIYCIEGFKSMTCGSVKLLFSNHSERDILKLKEYFKGGAVKLWILSLLDEDSVETLNRLKVTEAILEMNTDDTRMTFEEIKCGCLCVINRHSFQENVDEIQQHFDEIEIAYMDRLIESKMLPEKLIESLLQIKNCDDFSSIKQKLVDFLLQDGLPQASYCLLESMLKANEYKEVIQNIQQRQRKPVALRCALVSTFGKMMNDLEPLVLQKHLDPTVVQRLQFQDIERVDRRNERVIFFLERILKDENTDIIQSVLEAMKKKYQSVVNAVTDVLNQGSLCDLYRCPRLKGPICVFSKRISLLDAGKTRIESMAVIKMRVCLVKVFFLMKEEVTRAVVILIVCQLKDHKLLSEPEFKAITKCVRRREAVDKLLKMVLSGVVDMHTEFRKAMQTTVPHLAEKLNTESASLTDIKVFSMLEQEHQRSKEVRLSLTQRQYDVLLNNLNNEQKLDMVNDHLLSKLIFSIQEHTDVVSCAFELQSRAKKLIDTLQSCHGNVFDELCGILTTVGMSTAAYMLKTTDKSRVTGVDSGHRDVIPQLLVPSLEEVVVSSIKRSTRNISQQDSQQNRFGDDETTGYSAQDSAKPPKDEYFLLEEISDTPSLSPLNTSLQDISQKIGFNVEDANRESSVVLKMTPRGRNSWQSLEMKCRSGQIKDFIAAWFENISEEHLKEGEYRLKLTIYTLTSENEPGSTKALICIENESQDVKGTDHLGVLSEELDITNKLLENLKYRHIIDESIEKKLSAYERRIEKNEFLLKEVMSHGKLGFGVLKEDAKETNEYLYNYMVENEKAFYDSEQNKESASTDPKPSSSVSYKPKKEVFFTSTVILKVKRKGIGAKDSPATTDLEVSCPQMINPICMFKSKDELTDPAKEESSNTDLSVEGAGLSVEGTGLSVKGTDLSVEGTDLSVKRTGMSVECTSAGTDITMTAKTTKKTTKKDSVKDDATNTGTSAGKESKTTESENSENVEQKGSNPDTAILYARTGRQRN